MRSFLRSMFGRMALTYVGIMVVLSLVIGWVALRAQRDFAREADQRMHQDLAANLAVEFAPSIQEMPDYPRVEDTIHNLMVYNPRIEIYVLDLSGRILSFFSDPDKVVRHQVDMNPIRRMLADPTMPVMGDDPRQIAGSKPFSVAPIDLGATNGYLYVILGGELVDNSLSAARGSHISRLMVQGIALVFLTSTLLGIALFLAHSARFRRMQRVVRRFANGDHAARAAISGRDEIAELSSTFNEMADTIQSALGELRLRDQTRREQVANISHDLKTPLSSILGYVETIQMRDSELTEEDRSRYLSVIRENANMLSRMITELGELARLESPAFEPALEAFYLEDLVQDATMAFTPAAEAAGLELGTKLTGDNPEVLGDVGMLERVLANLIRNAIQFTDRGGQITVQVKQAVDGFRVMVHDTGCGMAAEEVPKITTRFYRVDKSRTPGTAGLGLGLAISEAILNLHGTKLDIKSAPEKGSTMSFALSG